MKDKEQKLVGYIVYDIWTYRTRGPQESEWTSQVIQPAVHWKKKIYLSLNSAEEAARHLEGENRLAKAIIIPIYANREDLYRVREGHREFKERVELLNKNTDKDD